MNPDLTHHLTLQPSFDRAMIRPGRIRKGASALLPERGAVLSRGRISSFPSAFLEQFCFCLSQLG
jgi:hypothetical protein